MSDQKERKTLSLSKKAATQRPRPADRTQRSGARARVVIQNEKQQNKGQGSTTERISYKPKTETGFGQRDKPRFERREGDAPRR
ncbi:hypothetical protein OSH01_15470, partial [Alcaligenes endophyticus]